DRSTPPPSPFAETVAAPAGAVEDEPRFWERWTTLFERLPQKDADADKSWSEWWTGLWHPVPTTWFQSINPLLILLLAALFAGRLFFDASSKRLRAVGVFPDLVRDKIVADTAPADFIDKVKELQKTHSPLASRRGTGIQLPRTPPGFDLRYAGFGKDLGNQEVHYDPATRTRTTTIPLEEK